MITWYIQHHTAREKLEALQAVVTGLTHKYGSWKIAWGEIIRFQRMGGDIKPTFDVDKESLPVGLGPSLLGSLASYETVWKDSKMYGVAGNSFVAVVEFGKKVSAKSIVTGGQSCDPASKHFTDQAQMYLDGKFKDVFFYKEDVMKNAERTYHPGDL